jgi:hypothetical protein
MSRLLASAVCTTLLAACTGVNIKPNPVLPRALVQQTPAAVGLIVQGDMSHFIHKETRWGEDWTIDLGDAHSHVMSAVFKDIFPDMQQFSDLESARKATGLKALFEPRIEQYSFATARETGGRYYAVTIRYRINLYTPGGEQADSFTLTGYGNALATGGSSGKLLAAATVGAMRDAAAKFLTQFPEQPAGQRLARNEAVVAEEKPAQTAGDAAGMETVPIEEPTNEPKT